jgi:hypothetical protein
MTEFIWAESFMINGDEGVQRHDLQRALPEATFAYLCSVLKTKYPRSPIWSCGHLMRQIRMEIGDVILKRAQQQPGRTLRTDDIDTILTEADQTMPEFFKRRYQQALHQMRSGGNVVS